MPLKETSLLELCAERLQCYISDLAYPIIDKNQGMKKALFRELSDLKAEQFELYQWNEGISYVLGGNRAFEDAGKAREYLINQLGRIKSQ